MARSKNLLSKRNRNASFTGAQVAAFLEKHGAPEKLAASKRARIVRDRSEFDLRALMAAARAPHTSSGAYAWSLEAIMAARDDQMRGHFARPARLAESFNTDDALFTARSVRLAPVQSLDVKIDAGPRAKGDSIADEASALFGRKGIAFSRATENSIRSCLVDHGIAFASIGVTPRADGSRWDPVVTAWPIEHVYWDPIAYCYMTRVDPASPLPPIGDAPPLSLVGPALEPIVHGNGRWIVFTKSELLPHRSADATLLPAALVWPCHAFANRDRRKGSASHGNAKVVGTLPENVAATDDTGEPTPEAAAFMTLLEAIASQDSPFGIQPFGSKVEILANPSNMWQVFSELAKDAEKAAARIYLGTDGVLGAQGGAPGVDVVALFGLHSVKIQSDMQCINDALQTGLIEPWTAWNFGDSRLAPTRSYVFPDPDQTETQKSFGERNAAFLAALKAAKDAGFALTSEYVADLAEGYGVPVPAMAAVSTTPAETPAPATDTAETPPHDDAAKPAQVSVEGPPIYGYHMEFGVVTPNEVRAQLRLPPIEGGDVPIAVGAAPATIEPANNIAATRSA